VIEFTAKDIAFCVALALIGVMALGVRLVDRHRARRELARLRRRRADGLA